jgi:N6-adenosine-specific RNA methylase IME4
VGHDAHAPAGWTRANAELCLLFTKGSPKRKARNVRQVIIAPVGVHSAKPDEQYERIERLVDGPYVEVFARRPWPGWNAIGNEIDGRDVRDVLMEAAR